MNKRVRLKDLVNGFMECVVILLIVAGMFFIAEITTPIQASINDFEPVELTVYPGETVWSIQESLTPNEDMRIMISYVCKINEKESVGNIKAYERITFLQERR